MRKGTDLSGMTFMRLKAIEQLPNPKSTGALWRCICDCGNETTVKAQSLKTGATRSCGCFNKEVRDARRIKHGQWNHPLFRTWEGMVSRCTQPQNKDWLSYGGRGIKVCDSWLESPEKFFRDMGARPHRTSLDRIDVNGNYEPENCRWATTMEQGANKRNNVIFNIHGESLHFAEVCRKYNISETTFSRRIKAGVSAEDAVAMPTRPINQMLTIDGVTKNFPAWAKQAGITATTIKTRLSKGWSSKDAVFTPTKTGVALVDIE